MLVSRVYLPAHTRGKTGSGRRYHTDPSCPKLELSPRTRPVDLEAIDDAASECAVCSGEWSSGAEGERSDLSRRLLALEPEDVGLSPMPPAGQKP